MPSQVPFPEFDFSALDDPHFKEDSVREEILAPLLRGLGYSATGENRIVRSKALVHPFVTIGTHKHKINIVPDYTLFVSGKPAWVLEAKAPGEDVRDPSHVAQAYSYAIHSEVRVSWYAVSNGGELALYHVHDATTRPRFSFELRGVHALWPALMDRLAPDAFLDDAKKPHAMLKDLGIHLLKMGVLEDTKLHFLGLHLGSVGRTFERMYTLSAPVGVGESRYLGTFDFDHTLFVQMLGLLPPPFAARLRNLLREHPVGVSLMGTQIPTISLEARRGTTIQENEDEHFCPLTVAHFH